MSEKPIRSEKARDTKARRKRMREIMARFQKYVAGYDKQTHFEDYSDKTFIDDMLYGIGSSMEAHYTFAGGYEKFKARLREHLGRTDHNEGREA